ncbi:MAG: cyclase family protein [Haloarculaceae archaeon]
MSPDHTSDGCGCSSGTGRRNFMRGCGAAVAFALAGTAPSSVAAQESDGKSPIEELLSDAPKDWGRWGEEDELGRLNLLGSEQAFEGMKAATKRGRNGVQRFTLQLSMTGEVINPDPDQPEVIFPPGDGSGPQWPSTDTGDPAFPPRTPARRDNTTPPEGSQVAGGVAFVDDKFAADFFLQGTTHLDALGHAWYGEQIYNGFDVSTTNEEREFETTLVGTATDPDGSDAGDAPDGTDAIPDNGDRETLGPVAETNGLGRADISGTAGRGLAGRGVLLDVGRHLDAGDENGRLPLGYGITHEDLMATADAQGTTIQDRDLLLVRTGSIERTRDPEAEWAPLNEPGLLYSEELVDWIAGMDIPYVGADNLGVEKVIQTIDGQTYVIPLHGALLRNLGVYLNEILDLSELAAACAADGIYEFLFTAAPLNVERGSGAPVNPVVLKATTPSGGDKEGDGDDSGDGDDGDGNGGDKEGNGGNGDGGDGDDGRGRVRMP